MLLILLGEKFFLKSIVLYLIKLFKIQAVVKFSLGKLENICRNIDTERLICKPLPKIPIVNIVVCLSRFFKWESKLRYSTSFVWSFHESHIGNSFPRQMHLFLVPHST